MEIKEILLELRYNKGWFPYEAVREAIRKKDEIIPELLKILEYVEENIDQIKEEPNYMAHLYAMFLLAQFREKQAYPLIVKIFSHPGDTSDKIGGEFITEDLSRVLASVCGGDTTLIKQHIEDRNVDEYVRNACLESLLILVVNGIKTRDEISDYFKSLFRGKLEREFSMVWNGLVVYSSKLCLEELYEDIKKAFEEELVEPGYINLEGVDNYFSMGWEKNFIRLKNDSKYQLIDDTIKCMEWWACFSPVKKVEKEAF